MPDCAKSKQTRYTDGDGNVYEVFWLEGEFIFENGIRNLESWTRTPPGWVLHDNGYCTWESEPPPRPWTHPEPQPHTNIEAIAPQPPATTQPNIAGGSVASAGDGGGALLILLGIIGAAGYAFYQQKFGKTDEQIMADDYHPMSDAPALPVAYTDEHLDHVYGRGPYPQYQGITQPSPWGPVTPPPPPPPPPPPDSTYVPPVESTDFSTGGMGGGAVPVEPKQAFELQWLPAPAQGYLLTEESLIPINSQAKCIVRDALKAGISRNFLLNHVFKVSKNTRKHELLNQLIASVEQERGYE